MLAAAPPAPLYVFLILSGRAGFGVPALSATTYLTNGSALFWWFAALISLDGTTSLVRLCSLALVALSARMFVVGSSPPVPRSMSSSSSGHAGCCALVRLSDYLLGCRGASRLLRVTGYDYCGAPLRPWLSSRCLEIGLILFAFAD